MSGHISVSPRVDKYAPAMCGIYAIVNEANGRRYIGSSVHIAKRWRDHIWELTQAKHLNPLLQNAWNKHGAAAFTCQVVEFCSPDAILDREQAHIDANEGGYNLCFKAGKPPSGNRRGVPCSESTKRRLSELLKGKRLSAETRQRMSESRRKKPRYPYPPGLTKGQKISFRKFADRMAAKAEAVA